MADQKSVTNKLALIKFIGPHHRHCASMDTPPHPNPLPWNTGARGIVLRNFEHCDRHKLFGEPLLGIEKDKRSVFIAGENIGQSVIIEIDCGNLRSDAGMVVDQVRYDLRLARGGSLRFKPIKHKRSVRFNVPLGAVRPASFPGYEIGDAVMVEIRLIESVQLADSQRIGIHVRRLR